MTSDNELTALPNKGEGDPGTLQRVYALVSAQTGADRAIGCWANTNPARSSTPACWSTKPLRNCTVHSQVGP